jgi:hypothetical protein
MKMFVTEMAEKKLLNQKNGFVSAERREKESGVIIIVQ